ncbi:hypothetical protein HRbin20_00680 [bacterium HR20]|nr:hypothetical protein HRbin20_00680 [bacterium HR20]
MKRLLGVTLLAAVLTAALSAQWQMLARIDGADVGRLYQSPSGVLYVQLASGMKIFRSYDGGILWSPLELPSAANQASFAPCADSLGLEVLLLLADGQLYRSTDNGFSWHELPLPRGIQQGEELAAIHAVRYGELVLLTTTAAGWGVYLSRDNAESALRIGELPRGQWRVYQAQDSAIYCYGDGLFRLQWRSQQLVQLSAEYHVSMTSTQEYSGAPVLLWAIRGSRVVRSSDQGMQWSEASAGLGALPAGSILLGGREGTVFCFVPTASGDSTMIYRRVSGVQTWSLAGTQAFAARDAAASQSGTLLVTTPDGVFSSEENGMFWSNSSSGIQGVGIQCAAVQSPATVVAVSTSGRIYRSLNGGISWARSGMFPPTAQALDIAIAVPTVVIGTTSGLWCSLDGGASFQQCSTATDAIIEPISSIAQLRGMLLAVGSTSAYISSNGMAWTKLSLPLGQVHLLRSADSLAVISTQHSLISIESIMPLSARTIATTEGMIVHHDIAADGSIGIVLDSAGALYYQRFSSTGRLEVTVPLSVAEIQTMALSRGGTAYIAPRSQSFLYVIGRNQATATVDTTIGEPVLYLRRQQSGELLATTAYGAIYRMAADSVLSTHEPARVMLTITPNPASDRVTITADVGIKRVRVYDLIGTVQADIVAQQPAPAKIIEIGSLPAGYYTVVVHTALGITAHPLIIER